jgi:DnaJ-class molecular chaperone
MKCPKCDGSGFVDNPSYYQHSPSWSWEHDIAPRKECKNCNGSGFIIGNIKELAERLLCAANGVTITPREAKQMYNAIMK